MFINGVFHAISLCTICQRRHPKILSCYEYDQVLVDREITKLKEQMLKHLIAPDVHPKPPPNLVIKLRGRVYDLHKLINQRSA